MNTSTRGTSRKPVAVRGKRLGPSSFRSRTTLPAKASDNTAADSRNVKESKNLTAKKDVTEEDPKGIAWKYRVMPQVAAEALDDLQLKINKLYIIFAEVYLLAIFSALIMRKASGHVWILSSLSRLQKLSSC